MKLGAEAAGWTFERAALVAYLEHSSKSPRTGKDLPDTEIVPDTDLKERLNTHYSQSSLRAEEPPENMLLLFAALPGSFASLPDSDADGLGYFARQFVPLVSLDVNISTLCVKVRHRVSAATKGEQIPWEIDNLTDSHQFSMSGNHAEKLVENYKLDCWYWESLELMRKVFLTGLMCFFRRGSTEQLIFGAIVSGLFLADSVSKRPFVTKYDNDFKIVTDAALMITFNLSLLLKDTNGGDGLVPLWVLGAVLVIVNVIAPLVLVSINIHGWRKRQKQEKQLAASKNGDATTFANPLDAEE